MDQVRFRFLGPMQVTLAGEPLPLPGSGERALLAQLLLAPGRTLPATLLIDRLWAGSALPADPANALQIRVSKLRRWLATTDLPELVARDGIGYRADVESDAVDAVELEHRLRAARTVQASDARLAAYDTALALWRGDPLVDFATEPWALTEAGRLRELHLAALTERSELALGMDRHSEVVRDLEPVVADDPALEPLARQLMIALYRGGRQVEALDVFTRTRDFLAEELGLEPSQSLRSAQEQVLRQDSSIAAAGPASLAPVAAAPAPMPPTNLPAVARTLIGRDEQLAALADLIASSRLVTLVGPGGAGKTSLALAAVVGAAAGFAHGAYGVRLATAQSGDDVPLAVADALGVPLDGAAPGRSVVDRVLGFVGDKRMLVLLDNCEHVIDAAAALVDDLLGRCPHVRVVVTSREALAVPGEVQVPVGPLEVPSPHDASDQVMLAPAAQLFWERASAVRPDLRPTGDMLLDVARIVRALDGIPLAIELAAARASSMSTSEIAARLDQRFSLLTWGARTADARQRTLRAAVDWSYALLTGEEQRAFESLSVFQGGWDLAAAEAVVADDGRWQDVDVDGLVARLVEQSMVVVVDSGQTTRYRMLETLRQYAAERLDERGAVGQVRQRHATYFRELTLGFEVEVRGPGQRETLRRLREEQPNLRAALGWFSGAGDAPDAALEMAGALGLFWHLGRHLEGRDLLEELLAGGRGSTVARARALQAVSIVERPRACLVHPSPRCAATASESLAAFERSGDRWRAALSKVLLAVEGVTGADPERSATMLAEAEEEFARGGDEWGHAVIGFVRMETALKGGQPTLAVEVGRAAAEEFRRLDDRWGLSAILYHLGWGLRQFGRYGEAGPVLEDAIAVAESAGIYNTVQWALADLAVLRTFQGRYDEATDLLARSTTASIHVGDGAGEVLAGYGFALLAQLRGDWADARAGYQAAIDGFQTLGTPVSEGLARWGLARCDEISGDDAGALAGFTEALALGERLGEPGLTASALEGLARVARRRGEPQQAVDLAARAADLRARYVRPAPPHERQDAIAVPSTVE